MNELPTFRGQGLQPGADLHRSADLEERMLGAGAHRQKLTLRSLNRALLARQGLLEPIAGSPAEVVERVGAVQAQHWPAVAVAIAARTAAFELQALEAALAAGELVFGTLLRGTLHVVSAREHPEYAAVTAASGADDWRRATKEPAPGGDELRRDLAAWASEEVRSAEQIDEWIERHVAERPGLLPEVEVERLRASKWRPLRAWSGLVRVAADGRWSKTPVAYRAAPAAPGKLDADAALDAVVRRHLRAFGPAAAEDVAAWSGRRVPQVRAALDRLAPELVQLADESGRLLHDLPDACRPEADTPAPPRLLPWFDSTLLAYSPKRRGRILPDAHRDAVYNRANLRYEPTFLVDGFVAGTWGIAVKRREATLTLRPLEKLDRATRDALAAEAEALARATQPAATSHRADFA
jgi:hypothetical protein